MDDSDSQTEEKNAGLKTRHYKVQRRSSFFSTWAKSLSLVAREALRAAGEDVRGIFHGSLTASEECFAARRVGRAIRLNGVFHAANREIHPAEPAGWRRDGVPDGESPIEISGGERQSGGWRSRGHFLLRGWTEGQRAKTEVERPPRGVNSPRTTHHSGRTAATMSRRILLTAFS